MNDDDLSGPSIGHPRRRVLAALGSGALASTAGCLGIFAEGTSSSEPPGGWHTERFTTARATETFSRREGTRTPFAGVEQIYAGEGTLVIIYFDYAHEPSIRWWREEVREGRELLADDAFRPTLLMFPVPINEWSMLLPSALFEIRARATRGDAWAFHEALVQAAPDYSFDLLRDLAEGADVDGDSLVEAARTRRRRDQALAARTPARESGARAASVPAFRRCMHAIVVEPTDALLARL